MIDPTAITDFNRGTAQKEEFLLFCLFVAGKNSRVQAAKLSEFISAVYWDYRQSAPMMMPRTFFGILQEYNEYEIEKFLRSVKAGQYKRLARAISHLRFLDVEQVGIPSDLEKVYGVGPKTSRFFLLHTRLCRCAVLDTHILKFLRSKGVENVPKGTPQNPRTYDRLEKEFLCLWEKEGNGLTLAEFDQKLWVQSTQK